MEVSQKQLIVLLREGRAPLKARAAVARAALPLQPRPLLESLDILADDPDPEIQAAALASLERLPETIPLGVVSSPALAPELLDRLARRYRGNAVVARAIAGNSAAGDKTVAFLATLPHPAALETIARDQVRLERSPETMAALLANPETPETVARPWRERQGRLAPPPGPASATAGPVEDEPVFETVLVEEVDGDEPEHRALETDGALNARQTSIYALLKQMTMGQKVALAVKGNRDVRNILIASPTRCCASRCSRIRGSATATSKPTRRARTFRRRSCGASRSERNGARNTRRQGARAQPEGAARRDPRLHQAPESQGPRTADQEPQRAGDPPVHRPQDGRAQKAGRPPMISQPFATAGERRP